MKDYDFTNKTSYSNERLINDFNERAYVKDDVIRWKTNDRTPPQDFLEDWLKLGLITLTQSQVSQGAREEQEREAIMNYINYRKENGYSAEEKVEIRANLGDDAVDVFTGRRIFA